MSLKGATRRLEATKQSLDDAYSPPDNFLEVEVTDPQTQTVCSSGAPVRFTDYRVRVRTNLPVFAFKDFTCRRRYSDFEWLRDEIAKAVQINIPELPGKALLRRIPFLSPEEGLFEPAFLEERRQGLERFLSAVSAHPLVQTERSLHVFLQSETIDRDSYVPGKVTSGGRPVSK